MTTQGTSATPIQAYSIPSWVTAILNREKLNEFVVVDIETNGLDCSVDSILSIAAVRFIDGVVAANFYSLMKPVSKTDAGTYNNESARAVNKITETLIEAAPDEKEVMLKFSEFVGVSPVVGHNIARFDARFIDKAFKRHKILSAFGWQMFDTFAIARSVGGFEKNSLEVICKTLKIPNLAPHHALADCLATGELMVHFLKNHYAQVIKNEFVVCERLKSDHIDRSPLMKMSLNNQQVAEAGLSSLISRLDIAQTIVDSGGKYLHSPLKQTTKFLTGDLEAEDKMIRRTSKFGSASSKARKASELDAKSEKSIEFVDLDHFARTVAIPHLTKLTDTPLHVEIYPDEVSTSTEFLSLDSVWRDWNSHVASLEGKSTSFTSISTMTTKAEGLLDRFKGLKL